MKDETLDELIVLMRMTARAFRQRSFQELKQYNLTFPQSIILKTLSMDGPYSLANLSEQAGMTTSSVSGIVDRLEANDWVTRRRDENDRRVVWIELSDEGKELVRQVPALNSDHFKQLLRRMPEEDVTLLVEQLKKFYRFMEEELNRCGKEEK
ncbi:MarR family winged helix-turn-helix transcriptional regulator [Marininema halotolerans]|uniref:DNA-binding transcriptional regulator, MarR family n=1 Tax=Marininema halotolerans TaxID=1155944 RepID=A0A1I6TIQ4_9BACL|nr:MarR family transcriptional regulator [Marininema halotolerans]SFS89079.1 DNA-binding transcriptional regulator, MarR family [Marininema halotolerans]